MRIARMLKLLLPALVLASHASSVGASDPDDRAAPELVTPFYRLVSHGASPDDVELAAESLDATITNLLEYFDDDSLEPLLRRARVTVHLHGSPTPRANENTATARTGTDDGSIETYFAEIHLLAPSALPEGLRTSTGLPKDRAFFQRLLAHEYSTVPLQLITRMKPEGWRFTSAPRWFVQGYEEYLAYTTSAGDQGGAVRHIVEFVASRPDRVRADFGLDVTDPYITGAVLILFMHERFGSDRVLAILTSPEPTFGRAVRASLGVTLDEFYEAWRAWIAPQGEP